LGVKFSKITVTGTADELQKKRYRSPRKGKPVSKYKNIELTFSRVEAIRFAEAHGRREGHSKKEKKGAVNKI